MNHLSHWLPQNTFARSSQIVTTGKWKLVMQTANRLKTAFASHKGLCAFLAISFGLASNPARVERLVKIVPCELYLEKRLVHLDNAILFEKP